MTPTVAPAAFSAGMVNLSLNLYLPAGDGLVTRPGNSNLKVGGPGLRNSRRVTGRWLELYEGTGASGLCLMQWRSRVVVVGGGPARILGGSYSKCLCRVGSRRYEVETGSDERSTRAGAPQEHGLAEDCYVVEVAKDIRQVGHEALEVGRVVETESSDRISIAEYVEWA